MKLAVEAAKELTLWHTRTFRPILTHDELDPILAAAGFVALPVPKPPAGGVVAWREYAFRASSPAAARAAPPGGRLPRPRLPYPRIGGAHLMAYRAFFDALEFYLGAHQVSNLFHVRSMPLARTNDRIFETYRPMRDLELDDEGVFVYRDGTLDNITMMVCSRSSIDNSDFSIMSSNKMVNESSNSICLIPLEELLPKADIVTLG